MSTLKNKAPAGLEKRPEAPVLEEKAGKLLATSKPCSQLESEASLKTFFAAVAALGFTLFGNPVLAAPIWSGGVTVDYMDGASSMTVYFIEATPNPASCTQGPLKVVSWESADPAAKNFMAMMLAAKVSGRQVKVLVDDTSCLWTGWPKLISMKLL